MKERRKMALPQVRCLVHVGAEFSQAAETQVQVGTRRDCHCLHNG